MGEASKEYNCGIMPNKQAEILFICGSPRSHTSEALLALLEQGARDAGARSKRFLLSHKHIDPCKGCGYCEKTGTCIQADERAEIRPHDDYLELIEALQSADALAVVSPLFFAGPPAQLKALYDRLQPFWARKYLLEQNPPAKRPAQIFILGGGGDSHGYDPLVTITRSALAVAGFSLEKIQSFIGFKHAKDIAPLPTEVEASQMAFGELAHLRKAVSLQREFEERALVAGGAFARFVNKSLIKNKLEAELEQVEEEMAELKEEAPLQRMPFEEIETPHETQIVDHVDSGFEALKRSARASKSSAAQRAVAEVKAEALAGSEEQAPPEGVEEASEDASASAPESLAGTIHDIEPMPDEDSESSPTA